MLDHSGIDHTRVLHCAQSKLLCLDSFPPEAGPFFNIASVLNTQRDKRRYQVLGVHDSTNPELGVLSVNILSSLCKHILLHCSLR